MEVDAGDYVSVGNLRDGYKWEKIYSNSAAGAKHLPRSWTIVTESGGVYDMWAVQRYAKASDMEGVDRTVG
jgi:hypothetical protein